MCIGAQLCTCVCVHSITACESISVGGSSRETQRSRGQEEEQRRKGEEQQEGGGGEQQSKIGGGGGGEDKSVFPLDPSRRGVCALLGGLPCSRAGRV